ncbi:MAG: hypothetical protein HOV78_08605 [Hamadaea sp.]|nr:hypothetical protein [Hamadaea sp.]NUT03390.1 hypothetical protein [Hamadaea sp.]
MTNVRPKSLDNSADALVELAGLLQAGRPELALSAKVAAPATHEHLARVTTEFATYAGNQFEDAVALIAALSTKLKTAVGAYHAVDARAQATLDSFLRNSTYQAP